MEAKGTGLTLAPRSAVVPIVLLCVIIAQGFYLWSFRLTFWPGPGHSPTVEQGLLVSHVTSGVLLALAVATVALVRDVPLGIAIAVWALLLIVNPGLWPVIALPGPIVMLVAGIVPIVRSRGRVEAAS